VLGNIKALIVVLTIAATTFYLAKPVALQFIGSEDFARRRLVWLILTVAFYASPNFWLYSLVAIPLVLWVGRRDSNPIALYLMLLHVIPPVGTPIPILGNNGLFVLDNYRLLAFCLLLPVTMRYRKNRGKSAINRFGILDVLLLALGALNVLLYTPPDLPHHFVIPDAPSNALRRGVLFFLDTYLLYFTVSRTCQSRREMKDAAATYCLACAVMAALAVFESMRSWLLYTDIASRWGNSAAAGMYLVRGGFVRAQTSAGHSIPLGYLLAVGFGFWLYLKSHIKNQKYRTGATLLLWGGLYATGSRGAWLGTAIVYFAFLAAGPRAMSRVVKGTGIALALSCLVLVSPIGDRVIDLLPKSGQPADLYRHRLAERGWEVVMAHPLFGDQFPWPEMEDLRQGEGIIDIVNTYLGTALNYGLVGLFCFVSVIVIGMIRVYARSKELADSDPDLALFGTCLVACIAGTLIMIDSASFLWGFPKMFYLLTGLTTAYAGITSSPVPTGDSFNVVNTRED
jgi:hypothetical protein